MNQKEDVEVEGKFESWAVLELMGHRRLGGFVREVSIGGAPFIRIDVPSAAGKILATQFYSPSSVYCITPTSEDAARALALRNQPEPVTRWELPDQVPQRVDDGEDGSIL